AGYVEVLRRPHAERDARCGRSVAVAEDQAVVVGLLVAAQVQRIRVRGSDDEAEHVDPEPTRAFQIGADQFDIRSTDDVGHSLGHGFGTPNRGTWASLRAMCTMVLSV